MSEKSTFRRNLLVVAALHAGFIAAVFFFSQCQGKKPAEQITWMDGSLGGGEAGPAEAAPVAPPDEPTPEIAPAPEPLPEPVVPPEPEPEKMTLVPPPPAEPPAPSEIVTPAATPHPTPPLAKPITPKPKPATPAPKPKPATTPKAKVTPAATAAPKPTAPTTTPKPKGPPAKKPDGKADAKKTAGTATTATGKAGAGKPDGAAPSTTGKAGAGKPGDHGPGEGNGQGPGKVGDGKGKSDFGWYNSMLGDVFKNRWTQPTSVVRGGTDFVTTLKIRIAKDGSISHREIVNASGNPVMDESVLAAAEKVPAVDPFPTGICSGDFYEITINFKLDQSH